MSASERWRRVNRNTPCSVCGKADWCLVSTDGGAAICPRVADGAVKEMGDAGWLHRLGEQQFIPHSSRSLSVELAKLLDFGELAREYAQLATPFRLQLLGRRLGVSSRSLRRLTVGFDRWVSTFPMRDATGRVIGIQRRLPDGRKLMIRGSRAGLFLPRDLPASGELLIAEGASDTAALLDLGFTAVGRPSCRGGTAYSPLVARGREVVVVTDRDPAGQEGATKLASLLRVHCPTVRMVTPPSPHKDVRQWRGAGATCEQVKQLIDGAEILELPVSAR